MEVSELAAFWDRLNEAERPIRLRLPQEYQALEQALLIRRMHGSESIHGGLEYHLLCVSPTAGIPLKEFIALPVEVQLMSGEGHRRSVCGIVAEACAGPSDNRLASYRLVIRDALAMMALRTNTRAYMGMSEVDISRLLLDEWRRQNPVLARAFDYDLSLLTQTYPEREFTMQANESDAAFLKRLWKRRGLSWFIRAGQATGGRNEQMPVHTLVLFDNVWSLPKNVAGDIQCHADATTGPNGGITAWSPQRSLRPGRVGRQSWDYMRPGMMAGDIEARFDQGELGNQFAASLEDHIVDVPHAGDDDEDYRNLTRLRMQRHEYEAKRNIAESDIAELCPGEWNTVSGHPDVDAHQPTEREFIVTSLDIQVENNFTTSFDESMHFLPADWLAPAASSRKGQWRYANRFVCVRRGVPIVPAFDPRTDLPAVHPLTATVVGPPGEEIHCDDLGRVKVRFPAMRESDHAHAQGAGASDSERDSAWIRVSSHWAGSGHGMLTLPRIGDEVIISFLQGDPDKPLITGRVFNNRNKPLAFSGKGNLPGNRYLGGLKSREIRGWRYNQLRMDDTPGQISAQLASEHAQSELNLGYLTCARQDGRGEPRGEGAELRTDGQMVLRAARGMLLTAWSRIREGDLQMARKEFLSLMEQGIALFRSMGEYASDHQALPQDSTSHGELREAISDWENGSNTCPAQAQGGAPAIGLTAPAGLSFATPKTMVTYAGVNLDQIAQRHLQLTAGQRFHVNAGKGISLFSHADGLRAIAHQGTCLMQSQHGDTRIHAAKDVGITASDGKITLMAKEILLVAEDGSFQKIGGGITLGTQGSIAHKAASFPFSGPATLSADLPVFEKAGTDQQFTLTYALQTGEVVISPNRDFEITLDDGKVIKGKSDDQGRTGIMQCDAMHIAAIRTLEETR